MYLNIITPCSRPENLLTISKSINIPVGNYRWIVVCDSETLPDNNLIPENCEIYNIKNAKSIFGNAQRNYAIDMVIKGHIYFNDDDTVLHPNLWDNIKDINVDFISFYQSFKNNTIRLKSDIIRIGTIDSHNFVISYNVAKDIRWALDKYEADGIFATNCYNKSESIAHIRKVLSIYNALK